MAALDGGLGRTSFLCFCLVLLVLAASDRQGSCGRAGPVVSDRFGLVLPRAAQNESDSVSPRSDEPHAPGAAPPLTCCNPLTVNISMSCDTNKNAVSSTSDLLHTKRGDDSEHTTRKHACRMQADPCTSHAS